MRYREFYYHWEWRLKASPRELWPLVSDTNRFNYDTGLPRVEAVSDDNQALSNARRRLRFSFLGLPVEWEEEPFEWVMPHRFGVVRRYSKGPVAQMTVLAELTPLDRGGSLLVYQVWARPSSLLGLVAIPLQIGWRSARRFSHAFRRYDEMAARGNSHLDMPSRVSFAPGGQARLANLRGTLLEQSPEPALADRLTETIKHADDLTLARLRPYVLADYWRADRRKVLELCLWATRLGLLDFQWDLLCPLCRGAKKSYSTLGDVQSQVHCDTCKIDFTVNFDRLVELTFRPNPAVRQTESPEFCVAGPQVTPHVVVQKLVGPGLTCALTAPLEEGRYRLRTLKLPGGQILSVTSNGLPEAVFIASNTGWPHDEPGISPMPTLHFENATGEEQLFILERMAWTDQAVTAAEVTALQLFRDLFSGEALRPGEQISVGSLTVLFTDICNSTRLYREIGDPSAFGLVMDHFSVLWEAIAAAGGTMVKTIGDAVMAVFPRPVAALRAVLSAQKTLAAPPDGGRPLLLKAGIHLGHCIAVTLNERLDYFGSTINLAARLESLSSGEDVIISMAVRTDPEVEEWLAQLSGCVTAEPFEGILKGFDGEHFGLWRVARS
jgi:class 3 adenylate cyclase